MLSKIFYRETHDPNKPNMSQLFLLKKKKLQFYKTFYNNLQKYITVLTKLFLKLKNTFFRVPIMTRLKQKRHYDGL